MLCRNHLNDLQCSRSLSALRADTLDGTEPAQVCTSHYIASCLGMNSLASSLTSSVINYISPQKGRPRCYRPLSEHSVPMVIHHIGGRVLTIEGSTHADVGDMNLHCTVIFGKARQRAVYTSHWLLSLNFSLSFIDVHWSPIWHNTMGTECSERESHPHAQLVDCTRLTLHMVYLLCRRSSHRNKADIRQARPPQSFECSCTSKELQSNLIVLFKSDNQERIHSDGHLRQKLIFPSSKISQAFPLRFCTL